MKKLLFVSLMLLIGFSGLASADDYYEFSTFSGVGSEYDVASYGNDVYYGYGAAVYKTTVSVADAAKANEPRFLDDGVTANPNYQVRSFTEPVNITLTYGSTLYGNTEMYVDANNIYTADSSGHIVAFDKVTGAFVSTITNTYNPNAAFLSYGDGKWWAGDEDRRVYSTVGGDTAWTYEFTFANMAGGHGDGMEYVNGYLFVSDMTSNFLGQWGKVDGVWTEINRFAYTELSGSNKYLEGMGFGALDHFWAGSGSYIYELGGGEIQQIIVPTVPEPATIVLLGGGLLGLGFYSRKRKKS